MWAFYNELNRWLGAQDITYFLSWLVVMAFLSMLCDIKSRAPLYLTRVVQGVVCVYIACVAAYLVSLLFHSFTAHKNLVVPAFEAPFSGAFTAWVVGYGWVQSLVFIGVAYGIDLFSSLRAAK